jgi:hypothetical protein
MEGLELRCTFPKFAGRTDEREIESVSDCAAATAAHASAAAYALTTRHLGKTSIRQCTLMSTKTYTENPDERAR